MTERIAMRVLYASSLSLCAIVVGGLWLLGAPVSVIGVGWMLVLVAGAAAAGQVTVHYASSRRRHDED